MLGPASVRSLLNTWCVTGNGVPCSSPCRVVLALAGDMCSYTLYNIRGWSRPTDKTRIAESAPCALCMCVCAHNERTRIQIKADTTTAHKHTYARRARTHTHTAPAQAMQEAASLQPARQPRAAATSRSNTESPGPERAARDRDTTAARSCNTHAGILWATQRRGERPPK